MPDWEYKDRPEAFCNVPIDEVGNRLAKLFELYSPDVVVTYADNDGYDHPDHVRASRVTQAAVERTGIAKKAYLQPSGAAISSGSE
jgi:N-acetyl-1-D-myo-inositol-2-amino-2-deoxy-alpha-D-glucopyranoside deacetylase